MNSGVRAGPHLTFRHLGEAEIEHFRKILEPTLQAQEDVLGLEIAVNDAHLVSLLQRAADLNQHRNRALHRHRAFLADRLVEVLALEQLHHDVERAVLLELPVHEDLRRVGMSQLAHRAGFAAESRR
jgi:hypothetical protein